MTGRRLLAARVEGPRILSRDWTLLVAAVVILAAVAGCGGRSTSLGLAPASIADSKSASARVGTSGARLLRDLDVVAARIHWGREREALWSGWLRQPARAPVATLGRGRP